MVALALPDASPGAAEIEAGLRRLAEADLDGLPDSVLGDDLVAIRGAIDRLEAEFARRLRRFERAGGHRASGAASCVAWLQRACNLSGAAAAERVGVARALPALPRTEAALRAGEIGYQHVAVIARTAGQIGIAPVAEAEPVLVDSARRLDPGRLRLVCRHLRHCIDPDGVLDDANAAHERRFLSLSETFDGIFVIDGQLDPVGGAALRAAVDALSSPSPGDSRSAPQRRADALVELAHRQLAGGALPSTGGVRPHLSLTAAPEALADRRAAAAAELGWVGPVPHETARRLACDASVTRVTIGSGAQPLAVGRTRRSVPAAIRRALAVRDRGCSFPHCDRPLEWTDAHHLRHWADGGSTDIDNLVLLCRPHHRLVHEGGWSLRRGDDGGLDAVPP